MDGLELAAHEACTAEAMIVRWFRELANGSGAASTLDNRVRFALTIATAGHAEEVGTLLLAAEKKRQRQDKANLAATARRRVAREALRATQSAIQFEGSARRLAAALGLTSIASVQSVEELAELIGNHVEIDFYVDDVMCVAPRLSEDGRFETFREHVGETGSTSGKRLSHDRFVAKFSAEFARSVPPVFLGRELTRASLIRLAREVAEEVADLPPERRGPAVNYLVRLYNARAIATFAESDTHSELLLIEPQWRAAIKEWQRLQWVQGPERSDIGYWTMADILTVVVDADVYGPRIARQASSIVEQAGSRPWPSSLSAMLGSSVGADVAIIEAQRRTESQEEWRRSLGARAPYLRKTR
jgi:hypothetical protein